MSPTLISKYDFEQLPHWEFLTVSREDSPGPNYRIKWRILKSIKYPATGPNFATLSPSMAATGHRMDLVNLEDMTMFHRMRLASSNRLRIKGYQSFGKEDSKSYAPRSKTHK
jgi:hypothetical protein